VRTGTNRRRGRGGSPFTYSEDYSDRGTLTAKRMMGRGCLRRPKRAGATGGGGAGRAQASQLVGAFAATGDGAEAEADRDLDLAGRRRRGQIEQRCSVRTLRSSC
jgi:hypothetical protein